MMLCYLPCVTRYIYYLVIVIILRYGFAFALLSYCYDIYANFFSYVGCLRNVCFQYNPMFEGARNRQQTNGTFFFLPGECHSVEK